MSPQSRSRLLVRLSLIWTVIVLLVVVFNLGMFTTFLTAFKADVDIVRKPPVWIFKPVLTHFRNAFSAGHPYGKYLTNSIIIGLGATAIAILINLPAAYSVVRFGGLGYGVLGTTLLLRLMPAMAFAIPVFAIFNRLHLIDTHLAVILMHTLFLSPTALLLFIGYVQDLPRELEDAALIDGANVWQMLWHVLLPVIRPGLSAVAILSFLTSWNEFLFAVILTTTKATTATVGTSFFIQSHAVAFGDMAAGIMISTIPTIIFVFVAQKQLIQGMTAGAVK
jgi:multiple sugar transport system permease protein